MATQNVHTVQNMLHNAFAMRNDDMNRTCTCTDVSSDSSGTKSQCPLAASKPIPTEHAKHSKTPSVNTQHDIHCYLILTR